MNSSALLHIPSRGPPTGGFKRYKPKHVSEKKKIENNEICYCSDGKSHAKYFTSVPNIFVAESAFNLIQNDWIR